MLEGIIVKGTMYIDKRSNKVYELVDIAFCNDRCIDVILYKCTKGNYYTLCISEFRKMFDYQEPQNTKRMRKLEYWGMGAKD